MTAIAYISDTEEIMKDSWSHIQHDSAAACELLARSRLPPALSAKHIPEVLNEILNVR